MKSIAYGAQSIWQSKDVMQGISCNDPIDETSPGIPFQTIGTMSPREQMDKSIEVLCPCQCWILCM